MSEHLATGGTQYRIRVVNKGSVPALHAWVEVVDVPLGQEILPSFWSDNALTLLPGEERLLTVSIRDAKREVSPRLRGSRPAGGCLTHICPEQRPTPAHLQAAPDSRGWTPLDHLTGRGHGGRPERAHLPHCSPDRAPGPGKHPSRSGPWAASDPNREQDFGGLRQAVIPQGYGFWGARTGMSPKRSPKGMKAGPFDRGNPCQIIRLYRGSAGL